MVIVYVDVGRGCEHQINGFGFDGQGPGVRMGHHNGVGDMRQVADYPLQTQPVFVDGFRVQVLLVEVAQHHKRCRKVFCSAWRGSAPQLDKCRLQLLSGCHAATTTKQRAIGCPNCFVEPSSQAMEGIHAPRWVQVDDLVNPGEYYCSGIEIASSGGQPQPRRFNQRRATTNKRVENYRTAAGVGAEQTLHELRENCPFHGKRLVRTRSAMSRRLWGAIPVQGVAEKAASGRLAFGEGFILGPASDFLATASLPVSSVIEGM